MSYTVDIADAVVDAINAAELSEDLFAERVYVPESDYTAIDDLQCKVYPVSHDRTRETRASIRKEVEIDIALAVKLTAEFQPDSSSSSAIESVDDLVGLCEELADELALGGTYAGYPIIRVEVDPLYDYDLLRTHRVFVARMRSFFHVS